MIPDEPSDEVRDAAYHMAIDPEVMGRHLIAQAETRNTLPDAALQAGREAAIEAMAAALFKAQDYPSQHLDGTGIEFVMKRNRMRAEVMVDALLERGWLSPDSLAQVGWWHPEMGAWTTEAIRADTLGWVPVYRKVTE